MTFSFGGLDIRHRLPDRKGVGKLVRHMAHVRFEGVSTPQDGASPSRIHHRTSFSSWQSTRNGDNSAKKCPVGSGGMIPDLRRRYRVYFYRSFDRYTFAPSKEAVGGLPAACGLPQHPCPKDVFVNTAIAPEVHLWKRTLLEQQRATTPIR